MRRRLDKGSESSSCKRLHCLDERMHFDLGVAIQVPIVTSSMK